MPLDRVWFFGLAVLNRVYNLTCLCPKQVNELICQELPIKFHSDSLNIAPVSLKYNSSVAKING